MLKTLALAGATAALVIGSIAVAQTTNPNYNNGSAAAPAAQTTTTTTTDQNNMANNGANNTAGERG